MAKQFSLWCAEVSCERWGEVADILERYPKVAIYPHHTVVFPIMQDKAVIATHVEYILERVFVTFVGLRQEWSAHCAGNND